MTTINNVNITVHILWISVLNKQKQIAVWLIINCSDIIVSGYLPKMILYLKCMICNINNIIYHGKYIYIPSHKKLILKNYREIVFCLLR